MLDMASADTARILRAMDPRTHARFLEYRERHAYFARSGAPMLGAAEFTSSFAEMSELDALGEDQRSDEQQARLAELRELLFMD